MKYALIGIAILGLALGGVYAVQQQGAEKQPASTPASQDADLNRLKSLNLYQ